jgi:hypothetical protein
VARIASTVLVVALLAATAAAFGLTQGLKNQPAGIFGTDVDGVFSPVCDCDSETATIAFKLREPDSLDVSVVDGSDKVVRTIERGREYERGPVEVEWDGRDDAGRVLPEGEYKPRVRLRDDRTTYTLPNPIRIDVTPPRLELAGARPTVFSPDGDRRRDSVTFRYRLSEPGRGMLFVDGKRRVLTRFHRTEDSIVWGGKVGGRALAAGARFALRVSADARRVRWSLGGRTGLARPGTLRLRAPLQKGRFTLTLSANGHAARAAVFVVERSS